MNYSSKSGRYISRNYTRPPVQYAPVSREIEIFTYYLDGGCDVHDALHATARDTRKPVDFLMGLPFIARVCNAAQ